MGAKMTTAVQAAMKWTDARGLQSEESPRIQQDISTGPVFTYFNALPTELRFEIWELALSGWAVWEVARCDESVGFTFDIVPVGPAPCLAGMACRESRAILERTYIKLVFNSSPWVRYTYWMVPSRTVLYINNGRDARDPDRWIDLCGDRNHQLSKLEHVALSGYRRELDANPHQTVDQLKKHCPMLQTVVIPFAHHLYVRLHRPPAHGRLTEKEASEFVTAVDFPRTSRKLVIMADTGCGFSSWSST